MKTWLAVASCTVIALFVATMGFGATAAEAPENISIDGCGDKQSAVEFPHKVHQGLNDCVTCHHTQEGLTADSDVTVETCTSCHLEPADATTPDCAQMSLSKNPFHVNCVGCHKESGAENAPTKCTDCHPKAG